jgi:hypothetical protein
LVLQFAHGFNELVPPKLPANYKTKPCRGYWIYGHCKYGDKCMFLHSRESDKDKRSTNSEYIVCQKTEDNIANVLHHVFEVEI